VCALLRVTPRRSWPLGRARSYPFTLTTGLDVIDRREPLGQLVGSAAGQKYIQQLAANNDRSVAPITSTL